MGVRWGEGGGVAEGGIPFNCNHSDGTAGIYMLCIQLKQCRAELLLLLWVCVCVCYLTQHHIPQHTAMFVACRFNCTLSCGAGTLRCQWVWSAGSMLTALCVCINAALVLQRLIETHCTSLP